MTDNQQKRALGAFSTRSAVETALHELQATGFPMNQVSVIAKNADESQDVSGAHMQSQVGDQEVGAGNATASNLAYGGAAATVLLGLTSLSIPGVGAVLAAGTLAASLVASVAGAGINAASANSVVQAMAASGIAKEQAEIYSDRLLRGDYVVLIEGSDAEIQQAADVLSQKSIQDWGIYAAANA
ncbi:general stress protein [Trichocoleus sp. FACHB-262]|uniref:general stress protein n=1 Tax=Trichocoleus sp. FACHB-262 TaxID=2692869 RepID=UPI001689C352|nr:general stress protein [Trichocoleus sp. FACHB-262]MBD2120682.1 general stress protein [Trichocoleus sp. FACHB-262]